MSDVNFRIVALMQCLSVPFDNIDEGCRTNSFDCGGAEYLVLTDEEADELLDDQLDSLLEDCVLCNIDEALHCYFDKDDWKDDAKADGRGHHLASYDSDELEEDVDGETYYIYRTN